MECNKGFGHGSVAITVGRAMRDNDKGNAGDESKVLRLCWKLRRCLISSFIQKFIVLKTDQMNVLWVYDTILVGKMILEVVFTVVTQCGSCVRKWIMCPKALAGPILVTETTCLNSDC